MQAPAAPRWQLPITIKVLQDVRIQRGALQQQRGVLYGDAAAKLRVIRKGETFQMVRVLTEGECRVRVGQTTFTVSSCPWLEGFRDHQTDFFNVLNQKPR